MKPIHNWRDVLKLAWSVRLLAFAMSLEFLNVVLGIWTSFEHGIWLTVAAGVVSACALGSRFVLQTRIPK